MGVIYKITSPSGKVYVGQTIQRFEARMASHRRGDGGAPVVREAIKKYGDKMIYEKIEENVPNELLDEREIFWIKELNCMSPNGYNLDSGGGVNREVSQFSKDNMSAAQRRGAVEKNGYEGHVEVAHFGFYPRFKVCGKMEYLSDGACTTRDEAIEILKEYARDPENFVKPEGSGKCIYKGGVYFHMIKKKWQALGGSSTGRKYLGTYKTKEKAEKMLEEYTKDPENFVKPGKIKRKKHAGTVSFHRIKKKWQALGGSSTGRKYLGTYKTKEEAESALDKYNTSLTP